MGKKENNKITEQAINILKQHLGVKYVRENKIVFTFEFRISMYEQWILNPSIQTIKRFLNNNGVDTTLIPYKTINNINERFKLNGRPSRARNKHYGVNSLSYRSTDEINEYLLSTGKFVKSRKGISFSSEFIQELHHKYPNITIEESLIQNNIDPEKVGYQRIYQLKLLFDGKKSIIRENTIHSNEIINKYQNHPFVKRITKSQFVLKDEFYDEAYVFNGLLIDDILEIFCIDYKDLSISLKNRIKYKLSNWITNDIKLNDDSHVLYLQIQRNKHHTLKHMIDSHFNKISVELKSYNKIKRKALCKWIASLPKDEAKEYSIKSILKKVGISKTSYYNILKNDNYGKKELNKERLDEIDAQSIKRVMEYKDIPKGSRMIYMMLPRLEQKKMSRNKIIRLMRKYNLTCKVRKSTASRIMIKRLVDENKKENLLKRRFRLCKPFEVLLTDVSYLKYDDNKTAYLSCVKDSSSGRILSVVVSDSQSLIMANDTLKELAQYPLKEDGIFHSDQGILYLNLEFQKQIKDLKLRQSMSRRGNCWDNASQESFFGHFKDECDYRSCTTIEEITKKVIDYMEYYNNERPQWTRNQMTPIEFEQHLLQMDEDGFNIYLANEQIKYDNMRQKAIENAKKRVKDLGAL